MSKSRPVTKNTMFVFGPAVVLAIVGLFLLVFASPSDAMLRLSERTLNIQLTQFDKQKQSIDQASSSWVVVNKLRPLSPANYAPAKLSRLPSTASLNNQKGIRLATVAAYAVREMAKEMSLLGVGKLKLNSGYRSFEYQQQLFKAKIAQYGKAGALLRSAKAGFSEHQTGLAVDVSVPAQGCEVQKCFGETKAGIWIAENAWRFGFIVRYEKDQTEITGYTYEPWHLRFVGKELAAQYKAEEAKTLEEFFGLPAARYYEEEITPSTSN